MSKDSYTAIGFPDVMDGLPCTKYILRSMTKHDQLRLWQRTYIAQLTKIGLSSDEIEQCFDIAKLKIPMDSPVKSLDLKEIGNELYKDDFVTSIIMDRDIPNDVTCEKFYYGFDKSKKACEVCPFSKKYKGTNAPLEKLLIRYLIESKKTAAYFQSFNLDKSMFVCVVDLNSPFIDFKSAYMIALYSGIVSAFSNDSFFQLYFSSAPGSRMELLVDELYEHIFNLKRIVYKSSLDAELENLFNLPLPSEAEVKAAANKLLTDWESAPKRKKRSTASGRKASSPDLFANMLSSLLDNQSLDSGNDASCSQEPGTEPDKRVQEVPNGSDPFLDDNIQVVSTVGNSEMKELHDMLSALSDDKQTDSVVESGTDKELLHDNSSESENDDDDEGMDQVFPSPVELNDEDIPEFAFSSEDGTPLEEEEMPAELTGASIGAAVDLSYEASCVDGTALPADEVPAEDVCQSEGEGPMVGHSAPVSTTVFEVVNNSDIKGPTIDVQASSSPAYEVSMDMHGDLIFHPTVRISELKACAVPLNTKNMLFREKFESRVMRDKSFCAEIVAGDDDKLYILLWVPLLNTFFYTDLVSGPALDVLLPLFSCNSIRTICYSPYLIYAEIRRNGGQVRNLQSLQARHYVAERTHTDYISVMLSYGIHPAVPGVNFKCTGNVNSPVFLYMPYYHTVFRKQERRIPDDSVSFYNAVGCINEAVGSSFDLHELIGGDNTWLASMPEPLTFSFRPVSASEIMCDGYYITYRADVNFPAFRDVLCELVNKGRFRKKDLILLSLKRNGCAFFVSPSYTAAFMSLYHRLFTACCIRYGARGTALSVQCETTGKPRLN